MTTITARVLEQVDRFPGYAASYYANAAGVTREQFLRVARQRLTIRRPGDAGWDFSYTAYFTPAPAELEGQLAMFGDDRPAPARPAQLSLFDEMPEGDR